MIIWCAKSKAIISPPPPSSATTAPSGPRATPSLRFSCPLLFCLFQLWLDSVADFIGWIEIGFSLISGFWSDFSAGCRRLFHYGLILWWIGVWFSFDLVWLRLGFDVGNYSPIGVYIWNWVFALSGFGLLFVVWNLCTFHHGRWAGRWKELPELSFIRGLFKNVTYAGAHFLY